VGVDEAGRLLRYVDASQTGGVDVSQSAGDLAGRLAV